jgi:hypothetical protein
MSGYAQARKDLPVVRIGPAARWLTSRGRVTGPEWVRIEAIVLLSLVGIKEPGFFGLMAPVFRSETGHLRMVQA